MNTSPVEEVPSAPLWRRVGGQFAWVSGGRLLAALLQAVLLVLTARSMETADFGLLMAMLGVIVVIQVVCDAGVGTFTTRERAAEPDSGGVASALRFLTVSSTALVTVAGGLLAVGGLAVSSTLWLMLPLAVWAAGERNADIRLAVALADGDAHVNVTVLVARRAGSILLFSALIAADMTPVLAFSLATATTATLSAAFAYRYIRPRVTTPPSLGTRALLRRSRPFWVASIALQARNLDALLVGAVAGSAQAGIYAGGSRLVNPLQILPTSLAAVLLPTAARGERHRAQLRSLLGLALLLVLGLCVVYLGLFVAAELFVQRALGPAYDGTETVIRVILVGLPLSAGAALLSAILQGQGRARVVALASSLSTGFSLAVIPVAASQGGARAAAVVFAGSFAVQFAVLVAAVLSLLRATPTRPDGTLRPAPAPGPSDPAPVAAIAFTPSPPDQSPNLRRTTHEGGLETYYRSMVVAFASYARWAPAARLVLVSDTDPPADYARLLDALGVERWDVGFTHRPAPGFTNRFAASLYSLDALRALCERTPEAPVALLDPDCVAVGPLDPLFTRARAGVCAYPLDITPDRSFNGLSGLEARELHRELDPALTTQPLWYGGECYAFTAHRMAPLLERAERAYRHTRGRDPSLPRVTTEEQALNFALRYAEVDAIDDVVRRIWTAPTRRTVVGDESGLLLWHLPAEKDRGITQVLGAATTTSSWFWTSTPERFSRVLGRHVGVPRRGPARWTYDTLGRVVRQGQLAAPGRARPGRHRRGNPRSR